MRNLPKLPAVSSFSYGIKNIGGTKALAISKVTVAGTDAGRYNVVRFPATLAAGATGTIDFTLDSQGQVGAFSGTMVVESNDPSNPIISLDISAQVGDDPDLFFTSSPKLQDLAKLPPVQTLSFAIKNGGLFDTLKISGITLSGTDAAYYTVKSFPATLAPGTAGTIEFTFDPEGPGGELRRGWRGSIVTTQAPRPWTSISARA